MKKTPISRRSPVVNSMYERPNSEYYQEAANPIATNPALWAKVTAPQISWGSTDIRYKKEEPAPHP